MKCNRVLVDGSQNPAAAIQVKTARSLRCIIPNAFPVYLKHYMMNAEREERVAAGVQAEVCRVRGQLGRRRAAAHARGLDAGHGELGQRLGG